jgi:plastocyanin
MTSLADARFAVLVALALAIAVPVTATPARSAISRFGGDRAVGSRPVDTTVVGMTNQLEFDPAEVTIHVGETVVWRNTSDLIHTVTDDASKAVKPGDAELPEGAEPWDSGQLKPGETFHRTFTVSGRYRYFCIPHEPAGMKGVIRVLP